MVSGIRSPVRRSARAFALGLLPLALAAAGLETSYDPEADVGCLRVGRVELVRKQGWTPEEVLPVPTPEGPAQLVLWRSTPRRNYLRLELWLPEVTGMRRTWPSHGEGPDWYRAELERRDYKGRLQLRVRFQDPDGDAAAGGVEVLELEGSRLVSRGVSGGAPAAAASVATPAAPSDQTASRAWARATLTRRAGAGGPEALAAADRLLAMKLEEARDAR